MLDCSSISFIKYDQWVLSLCPKNATWPCSHEREWNAHTSNSSTRNGANKDSALAFVHFASHSNRFLALKMQFLCLRNSGFGTPSSNSWPGNLVMRIDIGACGQVAQQSDWRVYECNIFATTNKGIISKIEYTEWTHRMDTQNGLTRFAAGFTTWRVPVKQWNSPSG